MKQTKRKPELGFENSYGSWCEYAAENHIFSTQNLQRVSIVDLTQLVDDQKYRDACKKLIAIQTLTPESNIRRSVKISTIMIYVKNIAHLYCEIVNA